MKKSIVFIGIKYYPSKGGTGRVVENLIRRLADRYEVAVYCYRNREARDYIKGVRTIQIPRIPLGPFGVFIYFILCGIHAFLFERNRIIHLHKTDCAFLLPLLTRRNRVIATSHEAPYLRHKWGWLAKKYFMWMERIYIRSKAVLTTISEPLAEYYTKTYGREILYIPNGMCITAILMDFVSAREVLGECGIMNNEYLLFAARRIEKTKGCHTFLSAMKRLGYPRKIVIAGETNHEPRYIRELMTEHDHPDVHFIGFVDSLDSLMALVGMAKYFVFPSETEGMSIMLLEAACSSTPVICSDIPENRAVFSEKEVLYFHSEDDADLAKKIDWAFLHENEMKQLAHNAIQKIKSRYNWDSIAEEYSGIYDNMISKNTSL